MEASDFALLLDATDGESITHVDNLVSAWADISGNGRHYTQATEANKPNNATEGLISFDGVDCLNGPIILTAATDWVVSVRALPTVRLSDQAIFAQATSISLAGLFMSSHSVGVYNHLVSTPQGNISMFGNSLVLNQLDTITLVRQGNTFTMRTNGVVRSTNSTLVNPQIRQVASVLGRRGTTDGVFMRGALKRVGVFHGTADADDLEAIERIMQRGFSTGPKIQSPNALPHFGDNSSFIQSPQIVGGF